MLSSYLILKIICGFNSFKKIMIKEPPIPIFLGKKSKNQKKINSMVSKTSKKQQFAKNQRTNS
jgi:hypothetical protein